MAKYFYCLSLVHIVSLSNSFLPNEGSLQITTDSGTKSVCRQSLKNKAAETVCSQLGYKRDDSLVIKTDPSSMKDEIFSGSIDCNAGDKLLSQCVFKKSEDSCFELSYIKCKCIQILKIYRICMYKHNIFRRLNKTKILRVQP